MCVCVCRYVDLRREGGKKGGVVTTFTASERKSYRYRHKEGGKTEEKKKIYKTLAFGARLCWCVCVCVYVWPIGRVGLGKSGVFY